MHSLSKSNYIQYRMCPEELWLAKNRPEIMPRMTDDDLHNVEQGNIIDGLAKELFSDTLFLTQLAATADDVFLQKNVEVEGLIARGDILVEKGEAYYLYEVKAATEVKTEHIQDIAFQKYVYEKAGYPIKRNFLVHVNKQYQSNGKLDLHRFLIIQETTEAVEEAMVKIEEEIAQILAFVNGPEPPKRINHECEKQNACPFFSYHYPNFPKYSVYDIARINKKKRIQLLEQGIFSIYDVPDEFPLSPKQRVHVQVQIARSRETVIQKNDINRILSSLSYPLYFLDYETFSYVLPSQNGIRPYQQMVFQYSLHVKKSPGSALKHYEYLLRKKEEPVRDLVAHLQQAMPTEDGTVIVWNDNFEKARNTELSTLYPEFANFLKSVNDRIFDLAKIFQDQLYIHPDFYGKYSIKKVLPVLAPEYDYNNLEVSNGQIATLKWHHLTDGRFSAAQGEKVYRDLLEYCKLDTLAMVRIFEVLVKL